MDNSEQTIFLLRDKPIIEFNPGELKEHELSKELFSEITPEEYERLKADIQDRGIQDPLHIVKQNGGYLIVSGHRRTKIAKELGIKVPCILRTDLKEEWQIKEFLIKDNLLRRHLNDYQMVRCGLELEPIEAKKAEKRKLSTLKKGGKIPDSENFRTREKEGRTTDIVAKDVGFGSGRQYEKAKKVYEEAPEPIKKQWQEGKLSTHGAYSKTIKQEKHEERVENAKKAIEELEHPEGVYQVIAIDPPWNYGTKYDANGRRVASPYPEMCLDELEMIEIPYDKEQCVLWLWTTNRFMHDAFHLLEKWGFEQKTILTWVKDKMGLGDWLRGQTEHCILAVKGHPIINLTNQTTALNGKAREHSRKPSEFYEMVNELCIGRKLDYFGREKHDGWDIYGTAELGGEESANNME